MKLVTIIFGSGWWVAWHLFIVGSIIPMLLLLRHLRRSATTSDPEEGARAYFTLLGIAFSLAAATVIDGALAGWSIAALRGAAWGTILGLAFCMLWTLTLFAVAKRLSVPAEEDAPAPLPATMTFAIWHAGIVVVNLTALHRIHE